MTTSKNKKIVNDDVKINMFHTHNDTDKYVFAVNGFFQLFDSEEDIDDLWDKYFDDDIENSGFGSVYTMQPRQQDKSIFGEMATEKLSLKKQIDVVRYIENRKKRNALAFFKNPTKMQPFQMSDLGDRLENFKSYKHPIINYSWPLIFIDEKEKNYYLKKEFR